MHDHDSLSLEQVIGLHATPDRARVILNAFSPVLAEISLLRELDLADVHPAVIFDPVVPANSRSRGETE